jgi:hypothetical protein
MKPEDLISENIGRKVLIDAIGPFENCRATFRAWQKNETTIICSLDSDYGKAHRKGQLMEIAIGNVRFDSTDRATPLPGLASK